MIPDQIPFFGNENSGDDDDSGELDDGGVTSVDDDGVDEEEHISNNMFSTDDIDRRKQINDSQPDVENADGIDPISDTGSDFSEKTFPDAEDVHKNLISPMEIQNTEKQAVKSGKDWVQVLFADTFPETLVDGFLNPVFSNAYYDMDISIHLSPRDSGEAKSQLRNQEGEIEAEIQQFEEAGDRSSARDARRKLKVVRGMYDLVSRQNVTIFDTGLYVAHRHNEMDDLLSQYPEIDNMFMNRDIDMKIATRMQLDGMRTVSPIAHNEMNKSTPMPGNAVAATMPFSTGAFVEPGGIDYGTQPYNGSPVIIDRWKRDNGYNQITIGNIGSGKSFSTKSQLIDEMQANNDVDIIMMDPLRGFYGVTKALGGEVVQVGGKRGLNPLNIEQVSKDKFENEEDFSGIDPYNSKMKDVKSFYKNFFAENDDTINSEKMGIQMRATRIAYENKGIISDIRTHENESPTLLDVMDVLNHMSDLYDLVEARELYMKTVDRREDIEPEDVREIKIGEFNGLFEPDCDGFIRAGPSFALDESDNDALNAVIEGRYNPNKNYEYDLPKDAENVKTVSDMEIKAVETDKLEIDDGYIKVQTEQDIVQILSVIDTALERYTATSNESEIDKLSEMANELITAMEPFRNGEFTNLAKQTDIPINESRVTYFDLNQQEGRGSVGLMMQLLLSAVYEHAKQTDNKIIFAIDEARYMMKDSETLEFLEQQVRHSRHHNLSIQLITQTVDEFFQNTDEGMAEAIIDNSSLIQFQRVEGLTNEMADEKFGMNSRQASFVRGAMQGDEEAGYSEALIGVRGEGWMPIEIRADSEKAAVIEFDPSKDSYTDIPGYSRIKGTVLEHEIKLALALTEDGSDIPPEQLQPAPDGINEDSPLSEKTKDAIATEFKDVEEKIERGDTEDVNVASIEASAIEATADMIIESPTNPFTKDDRELVEAILSGTHISEDSEITLPSVIDITAEGIIELKLPEKTDAQTIREATEKAEKTDSIQYQFAGGDNIDELIQDLEDGIDEDEKFDNPVNIPEDEEEINFDTRVDQHKKVLNAISDNILKQIAKEHREISVDTNQDVSNAGLQNIIEDIATVHARQEVSSEGPKSAVRPVDKLIESINESETLSANVTNDMPREQLERKLESETVHKQDRKIEHHRTIAGVSDEKIKRIACAIDGIDSDISVQKLKQKIAWEHTNREIRNYGMESDPNPEKQLQISLDIAPDEYPPPEDYVESDDDGIVINPSVSTTNSETGNMQSVNVANESTDSNIAGQETNITDGIGVNAEIPTNTTSITVDDETNKNTSEKIEFDDVYNEIEYRIENIHPSHIKEIHKSVYGESEIKIDEKREEIKSFCEEQITSPSELNSFIKDNTEREAIQMSDRISEHKEYFQSITPVEKVSIATEIEKIYQIDTDDVNVVAEIMANREVSIGTEMTPVNPKRIKMQISNEE